MSGSMITYVAIIFMFVINSSSSSLREKMLPRQKRAELCDTLPGGECVATKKGCWDTGKEVYLLTRWKSLCTSDPSKRYCCIDAGNGGTFGDPHFTTFDGRSYVFEGLCWYTQVKDCSNPTPDFEIAAKFTARDDTEEFKTKITAFMLTVGKEYVKVDGLRLTTGYTDGFEVGPRRIKIEEGEGKVTLEFTLKDTAFTVEWTLRRHVLNVFLTGSDYHGKLCGLLGNYDGDKTNDFMKPDGSIVQDVTEFGESWKSLDLMCDYWLGNSFTMAEKNGGFPAAVTA